MIYFLVSLAVINLVFMVMAPEVSAKIQFGFVANLLLTMAVALEVLKIKDTINKR